ncbi:MAG: lipoyl(octanoyl) transferase LipB [Acidimicrobiales bacterium]|nr:lipoyl(octanoyl) transferase LipB [Hyphomonadaceae bacterium]RZV44962.1 MAG: lipoyl(octanoyl) transferase LipB [Acidimicrobiales bacterium]
MSTDTQKPSSYSADIITLRESDQLVAYTDAVKFMENRVLEIATQGKAEMIWFLQHPPLYTAGTSANAADLVDPKKFEVYKTGRGGQYTYHGPGQRVVYVMLDLKKRGRDVRALVCALEDWIIETLAEFGIKGERRKGRVGVWVEKPDGSEAKIAALGIRIRKWVSFHGISINLNPDLSHFGGIVPCGISEHGVTSFKDMGLGTIMEELDVALQRHFEKRFGPLVAE